MARPDIPGGLRPIGSFEAVAEAIPHIVWLAAVDGSTDYVNDLGTGYLGFPRDAIYGWRWLDIVHPEDIPRARLGWEHATRSVTPFSLSYRLRRHDGEYRWHVCRARPIRGDDDEILRWLGTADDLDALRVPTGDDARLTRQVAELRSMLGTVPRAAAAPVAVHEAEPALVAADGTGGPVSPREVTVARLVAAGHTNVEIAGLLGLSLRSIETSRANLRRRLGLRTRADLVRHARAAGWADDGVGSG